MPEQFGIRFEIGECAVFFCGFTIGLINENTFFEDGFMILSVPMTAHYKLAAQSIDSLDTYSVETYAGSEYRCIVFRTCVQLGNCRNQAPQWDASPVISDRGTEVILDFYVNTFAESFVEFVDTIVDSFFQQYVDTVFCV